MNRRTLLAGVRFFHRTTHDRAKKPCQPPKAEIPRKPLIPEIKISRRSADEFPEFAKLDIGDFSEEACRRIAPEQRARDKMALVRRGKFNATL
ncbi:MAG: hypothetical protein WA400_17235, partial [Silvibacterium sp.]